MRLSNYVVNRITKSLAFDVLNVLAIILVVLPTLACGRTSSPDEVVRRFWEALAKNDQSVMLSCVEPNSRVSVDPFGCILPGGDLTLIISKGLKVEFSNMRYQTLQNDGNTAQVQVNGRIKFPAGVPVIGGMVREFQLIHTVIRLDDQWFLACP